jgi:hypothetical protein
MIDKNAFSKLLLGLCFLICCNGITAQEVISADIFKDDVHFLASDAMHGRLTGTIYQDIAAEYIQSRFMEIGLTPVPGQKDFLQSFYIKHQNDPHSNIGTMGDNSDSVHVLNVVGFIDNGAPSTIVLGAHFDHLGMGDNSFSLSTEKAIHNGADDNASGVSILIELARILKTEKAAYNYLFIAFSGEEFGLWGSNYFVKHPTYPLSKMAAMINMDMVGRLKDENTILVGGVGTSPVWKDLLEKSNTSHLKMNFEESGVGPSDHTSFYNANIPVLFFFTGQHSDYHKPSDDYEKINFVGMAKIATNILTLIMDLNQVKAIPFSKTKDPENTRVSFNVSLGIMPDYIYSDGGLRIDGVTDGKPASKSGLKPGDIITYLGGIVVNDIQDYMKALNSIQKGEKVKIRYKRDGKRIETDVQF